MYIHCGTVYNSKNLESTQMPINDKLNKEIWQIYIMEYYAAVKKKR